MRLEFMSLHRELSATIVYVTHDQAEAMTLASVIVVLRNGRVEQIGSPLEVYGRPRNRFVAGFIGSPSMNMIEGCVDAADAAGTHIVLPDGLRVVIPVDARSVSKGGKVTLGVRPEHVLMSNGGEALVGTVVAIERLGSESLVHAKLSSGEVIAWHAVGGSGSGVGDIVRLGIDASRGHLFDDAGNAFPPLRPTETCFQP
jgi:ABC-type sugar transport system ATPase subunit